MAPRDQVAIFLGMCGAFHHKDNLVRTRRPLSADDGCAAAQHATAIQHLPHGPVDVVRELDGKRELSQMRWGLVPRWWSKPLKELRAATFNARAETVETKPFFRDAFKCNRCLRLLPDRIRAFYCRCCNQPSGGFLSSSSPSVD